MCSSFQDFAILQYNHIKLKRFLVTLHLSVWICITLGSNRGFIHKHFEQFSSEFLPDSSDEKKI